MKTKKNLNGESNRRSTWSRLQYVCRLLEPYARPHRPWLDLGLAAALLVVACRLAFPWPLRGIIEIVFAAGSVKGGFVAGLVPEWGDPVLWLGAAFLVIVLCQGGAELVQRVAFARFAIRMIHDARGAAIRSLFDPAVAARRQRDPGDLIARVIGDSARVKAGLKGVLIHVAQNGVLFVGICVILLLNDLKLGLIFLGGGGVAACVAVIGATFVAKVARRHRRKEGDLASRVHLALVDEAAGSTFSKANRTNQTSAQADAEITKLEGLITWAIHGVLGVTTCVVLVVGVNDVFAGRLAAGVLFTFVAYVLMVHDAVVRLGRQVARLGPVLASSERLAGVFDGRGKLLKGSSPPASLVPLARRLELRGVPLRKSIALKIKRGERVAIIGPRGSGKTTLLEYLAGLSAPAKGAVRWDGIDLSRVDVESRLLEIAFLPDRPSWSRRRLRRVMRLPKHGDVPDGIRRLMEADGTETVLARYPDGAETPVSSYELSLRRRKALALIGVVNSLASVWLLDDPVSKLPSKRGGLVLTEVLAAGDGRTVVVALGAAAPQHIALFDRVVVLKRGKIRYDGPAAAWLERTVRRSA